MGEKRMDFPKTLYEITNNFVRKLVLVKEVREHHAVYLDDTIFRPKLVYYDPEKKVYQTIDCSRCYKTELDGWKEQKGREERRLKDTKKQIARLIKESKKND